MFKNIKIIVIVILILSVLSGCTPLADNVENMISPPYNSSDINNCLNALKKVVDKDVSLKYPKSGEFKSPINLANIDEEDGLEAIVFFTTPSINEDIYIIRMGILDYIDEKWELIHNIGVEAKNIEKLNIINTNDKKYICVGFETIGLNNKEIRFYRYNSNKNIERSFIFNCNEYEIFDIDLDNNMEVIALQIKKAEGEKHYNSAISIEVTDKGFYKSNVIQMDNKIKEYKKLSVGRLYIGKPALFIDGLREDNTISTQILAYENLTVQNLLYSPYNKYNLTDQTIRDNNIFCTDIDNDKIYEIPTTTPFWGYEYVDDYNKIYMTKWLKYSLNTLKEEYLTYSDFSLNYYFVLPDNFINNVQILKNTSNNIITFSVKKDSHLTLIDEILSIQVIKRSDYEALKYDRNYKTLEIKGHLVYMYCIYDNNSEIKITPQEVKERFFLFPNN